MNPHYHPYGTAEMTSSPHPPSPDNNNYHGHPGPGGPPSSHGRMMSTNGHGMGPLGHHQSGPHEPLSHNHHQHPAFTSTGPPSDGPHHQHQHSSVTINNNNNNNNSTVKICAGCGGKILERFLLHALDRYWHNSCLKCSCCAAMLADLGTSCFTKGGMILCKQDYMRSRRLFGNSGACSACGQTIPASEFVMRSGGGGGPGSGGANSPQQSAAPPHVFHLKCFMCSKCLNPLVPGDRYYMLSGSLVCEQDWHKLLKSTAAAPTVRKGKVGRPRRSRD